MLLVSKILVLAGGLLSFCDTSIGYPTFQSQIPNGANVPSPCNSSDYWPGVGHELFQGPGPLNKFGSDFLANGKRWTVALCNLDSDGDGKTNGQELGDPYCTWAPGDKPTITDKSKLSHPGVCDPIDSPKCQGKNVFLLHIETCRNALNMSQIDWCPAIKEPEVKSLELRFEKTIISGDETSYLCQTFQVPSDQQYHIIAWEPIIANAEIMHHLVFFVCDTPQSERAISESKNYQRPTECGLTPRECQNLTLGWSFGFGSMCYNDNTGVLMGKDAYKTVVLQIHYNNPLFKTDYVDSSGIKLYYTPKKRQYDIAVMRLGQSDIAIPPQSTSSTLVSRTFKTQSCSVDQLQPAQPFKLTSMLVHMHKTGKHSKIVLEKKNGKQIQIVNEDYYYDRPKSLFWGESDAVVVEPGDNFVVECTFKTTDRANWTFFGKNTHDEMCLIQFDIHPRPNNVNTLNFMTWGTVDPCDFANKTRPDYCPRDMLETMPMIIGNDTEDNLDSSCYDDSTAGLMDCCLFLRKHKFFSYPCVYAMAQSVVTKLIKKPADTQKIFNNMLTCISDYQIKTMSYFNSTSNNGSNGKDSSWKISGDIRIITMALLLAIFANLLKNPNL